MASGELRSMRRNLASSECERVSASFWKAHVIDISLMSVTIYRRTDIDSTRSVGGLRAPAADRLDDSWLFYVWKPDFDRLLADNRDGRGAATGKKRARLASRAGQGAVANRLSRRRAGRCHGQGCSETLSPPQYKTPPLEDSPRSTLLHARWVVAAGDNHAQNTTRKSACVICVLAQEVASPPLLSSTQPSCVENSTNAPPRSHRPQDGRGPLRTGRAR